MENYSKHYIDPYIRDPRHRLTVSVFGVGGTGSFLLSKLARLNVLLKRLYDYPGLHVTAYDYDIVEPHNYIRSSFSPSDEGLPKATTIMTRINRYYGLKWEAVNRKFDENSDDATNIVILCVDKLSARKEIIASMRKIKGYHNTEFFYSIDAGNNENSGQIVISSKDIPLSKDKPKNAIQILPQTWELFDVKEDHSVSCSMEESLSHQNIFINEAMALYTAEILKIMILDYILEFNVLFINMKELTTSKMFKHAAQK